MNLKEFRNEFDVLFNNVTSNQAPGLDSYEISVLLTKAEHQLVDEYFNVRVDGAGGGFDNSQRRQYDFSSIIRTASLFNVNSVKERISSLEKLHKGSRVYLLPKDFYLTVNELISDSEYQYAVLPIKYSEYHRLMCKPYNYPPKKSAWRIITDKKNCNYYHKVIEGTNLDYNFISSWADQKRPLRMVIKTTTLGSSITPSGTVHVLENITLPNGQHPEIVISDHDLYFHAYVDDLEWEWYRIYCDCGWIGQSNYYNIAINLSAQQEDTIDDRDTIELLKYGFYLFHTYLKDNPNEAVLDWDIYKTMTHTDAFIQADAPSKITNFSNSAGYLITPEVVSIPLVEVIGKFKDEPTYVMRYVKTLKPIILEDLDELYGDLTIDGETKACECELPEETHHEILERAVALAKITWAGSTATQSKSRE